MRNLIAQLTAVSFYAIRLRETGAYLTASGATKTSASFAELREGSTPPRLFKRTQDCRSSIREHCEMRSFNVDDFEIVRLWVSEGVDREPTERSEG